MKIKEYTPYKGPTKDYLLALINYPNYVKLLDSKGKNYEIFYNWVLAEALIKDKSKRIHSITEIAAQLKLKTNKVTKMIFDLYEDILLLNEECPEKFKNENETLCFLYCKFLDRIESFNLGLSFIPRKGEIFQFMFLQPKLGNCLLYVKYIIHEITEKGQVVMVSLIDDAPNNYIQLAKDKAYIYHEIGFDDYLKLDNEKMAQKLKSLGVKL